MKEKILQLIAVSCVICIALAAYGADNEVPLGQEFRLEKNKSIKITGADKELHIVGRDFKIIPYGVAGGTFVLYDVIYGDTVIEHNGRKRISFSDIPYQFIVKSSDYKTYAEMIVLDPVRECEKSRSNCDIQRLAIELRKPQYCEKEYTSQSRDSCFEYYIESTNETDLCKGVKDPIMICGYLKAVAASDPKLCTRVIALEFSSKCYQELAKQKGIGEAICDALATSPKHEIELCHYAFKNKGNVK